MSETFLNYSECLESNSSHLHAHHSDETGYKFENCVLFYCADRKGEDNETWYWYPTSEVMCIPPIDMIWGWVHLGMGIFGILFNAVALTVFIRMGTSKPYYIIIIFETLTDLIVCFVALYTGIFLIADRPSNFNSSLCLVAGWLWNWNMITTPLLLSLAGLLRIRAVYRPHDNSIVGSKMFIGALCIGTYGYGATFACYPFFFGSVRYYFYEWWSICDFVYNEDDHKQSLIYSLVLGPVPMCCSLVVIIVTNVVIARYLYLRYYKSWDVPTADTGIGNNNKCWRKDAETAQSKQVVWSLFLMTMWYLSCYSIIIFHNFKNLLVNVVPNSGVNLVISDMSNLGQTYFYAAYNFCAYLNSFANPIIQLISGTAFKCELVKMKDVITMKFKSAMPIKSEDPSNNQPRPSTTKITMHTVVHSNNLCSKI